MVAMVFLHEGYVWGRGGHQSAFTAIHGKFTKQHPWSVDTSLHLHLGFRYFVQLLTPRISRLPCIFAKGRMEATITAMHAIQPAIREKRSIDMLFLIMGKKCFCFFQKMNGDGLARLNETYLLCLSGPFSSS